MAVDIIIAKPSQSLVPLLPAKRRTNLKDMRQYQNIEGFLSVEYVVSILDPIHSISQFSTTLVLRPTKTDVCCHPTWLWTNSRHRRMIGYTRYGVHTVHCTMYAYAYICTQYGEAHRKNTDHRITTTTKNLEIIRHEQRSRLV